MASATIGNHLSKFLATFFRILADKRFKMEKGECINEFSGLVGRCTAPFRVTLRGIITEVFAIQGTVKEDESRLFTLVDNAGSWIKCCAIGIPERSLAWKNGNEVVLYFCWGRDDVGAIPDMIYLRKDTFVVLVKLIRHRYHSYV